MCSWGIHCFCIENLGTWSTEKSPRVADLADQGGAAGLYFFFIYFLTTATGTTHKPFRSRAGSIRWLQTCSWFVGQLGLNRLCAYMEPTMWMSSPKKRSPIKDVTLCTLCFLSLWFTMTLTCSAWFWKFANSVSTAVPQAIGLFYLACKTLQPFFLFLVLRILRFLACECLWF